jgi:immune inhibitor A
MSKGAYDITGQAAGWVQVPHSEAWYGAARRGQPMQDNAGHPDNPRQVAQLVVDAVDALAAAQPDFPWSDYDIEDQGDADASVVVPSKDNRRYTPRIVDENARHPG